MDHEVQMAREECYHAAEHALAIHKLLRNISEQQGLEGWVSSKITLANDYLNTVREHLEYELLQPQIDDVAIGMPIAENVQQGVAKGSLQEFAPGSGGEDGRWYTDDEIADIIGEDWFEFDLSGEAANISQHGERAKILLVQEAQAYFEDRGYHGVVVNDVRDDEDFLSWYISGNFTKLDEGVEDTVRVYGNKHGYYVWTQNSNLMAFSLDGVLQAEWGNYDSDDAKLKVANAYSDSVGAKTELLFAFFSRYIQYPHS